MERKIFEIREAVSGEFEKIGQLLVRVYAGLDGFPNPDQQPKYYHFLQHIGEVTRLPKVKLLVATDSEKAIAGAVVYFGDMQYYGSGGIAPTIRDAGGFRLLAVDPQYRGQGIGLMLSQKCVEIARNESQKEMIIHSTMAMQIAWAMYEKMGFVRSEELDFLQGELAVFGFRLML